MAAQRPQQRARGRWLGALALGLGLLSFGALPHPVAGEFPLLTAMLSVAGLVAGGMALVTRQKGAFATLLALMGILVSLFFPLFMLFLVLGWLNGLLVSH